MLTYADVCGAGVGACLLTPCSSSQLSSHTFQEEGEEEEKEIPRGGGEAAGGRAEGWRGMGCKVVARVGGEGHGLGGGGHAPGGGGRLGGSRKSIWRRSG